MALGYKTHQRKLWKIRALLVLVFAACLLVGWSVITRLQVEREMAARRAAAEAEYQALVERHRALESDVEYLKDERSVEAEMRKHFDIARAGESVIILLDDTDAVATSSVQRATSTANTYPWWQFWR